MNKPKLTNLKATYTQEEDSAGRPFEELQSITLETRDAGGGSYLVIETERWAVDSTEELLTLVQDFQARMEYLVVSISASSRNDPD